MSDRTRAARPSLTHGSRTKVSSETTLSDRGEDLLLARARVRSSSRVVHSFLRVRASASACLPSISCSPAFSRSV